MTTESTQQNSTYVPDATCTLGATQTNITVKEAARRLGISRSSAYRIDRHGGPFRFIIDGRRIFIDQASLESHIASITGAGAIKIPNHAESKQPLPQSVGEPCNQPQVDEPPCAPSETLTPTASLPVSRSEGQRGLIMRQRRQAFIAYYTFS